MAIDNAECSGDSPPLGVSPTKRWESGLTGSWKKLMARLRQRLRKRKDALLFYDGGFDATRRDAAWKWARRDVRCRQLYIIIFAVVRTTANVTRLRELGVDSTRFLSRDASARHSLEFRTFAGMIAAIKALQICLRLFVKGNGNMNRVPKEIC